MNYKEILENAVINAKKAHDDKLEIENVIQSLNFSIQDFTDGKMELRISTRTKRKPAPINLLHVTASYLLNEQPEEYQALCFYIVETQKSFELAEWIVSENGYPCRISYSNKKDVYCGNKQELEQALADLMNSAKAGDILFKMMRKGS
ncbi:hypothetical protein AB7W18_07780 [Providencia rettgeri]|nr:hypothetical protein [Providencia rettgeri]